MQFIWFSVVLVCLYFGAMYGFYGWIQKQTTQKVPASMETGCGTFLLGSLILGLAGASVVFGNPALVEYTWILCACFAVMYCAACFQKTKQKAIWVPLVSALGVYVLHKAMPASPIDGWSALILTAVWSGVMGLVMVFDRLPLLNFLTVGTWAMAFTTMYVLSLFGSPAIAVLSLLMLAPLWGMLNILVREGEGHFGSYATAVLGFVMGGIIALCFVAGSYGSALALLSYYLFEIFFFALAWFGLHPFGMQKGEFALEKVLTNHNPTPIIRVIFYRLLILSLIGALMWKSNKISALILIILVILLDTYNRLKGAGAPPPTIRSMWQDTKAAFKQTWAAWRNKVSIKEEKKVGKKAVIKTQKVPVKKKPTKRKNKK